MKDDVKSDEYVFIQQQLKANPVVVFSKTTCGYCSMVEDVFSRIKLSYNRIDIDERPDCDKLQELFGKMTGAKTVPRVFVGGKCIGGGTDTYTLHNEGKLLPLLEKAGAHFYKKDD
ncbi:hypothetical protein HELRODRAFT_74970 [Helobdella robusta]|uniref:Glutaredoxin domain-containing protein n=1 Tax=Helobdella robusta TaxID=6412 RepID=T1G1Y8_HELRO|nr:hypothetical protein HELRODRAFT_74970 [Helobdella robusta]ESO08620.1 hypothetical protein HELRODRAFT_74970 [Helobdella robusta]